jgi:hypothetical protein
MGRHARGLALTLDGSRGEAVVQLPKLRAYLREALPGLLVEFKIMHYSEYRGRVWQQKQPS